MPMRQHGPLRLSFPSALATCDAAEKELDPMIRVIPRCRSDVEVAKGSEGQEA